MFVHLLFQLALAIMIIRSVYVTVRLFQAPRKAWLDILFHISIAVAALYFVDIIRI